MARNSSQGPVIMLGKLISGFVGTQVAKDAGKSGLLGAVVGMAATRIVTRSPIGALTVGGAWLAHKMWKRQQEKKQAAAARVALPVAPATGPAPHVVEKSPRPNKPHAPHVPPPESL